MTHTDRLEYTAKHLKGAWKQRHLEAIHDPNEEEKGIVSMIEGWLTYAKNYPGKLGEDWYSGEFWAQIGLNLISLLSVSIGNRLDGQTLDHIIRQTLESEGFDADLL